MSHVRQQVRETAGTVLSASVAGLWNHVFETRIKPSRRIEPFLMVFVGPELSSYQTVHPTPLVAREMTLAVRGFLRITDDEAIEDNVDNMASEIEKVLTFDAMNTELSSKLRSLELQSSNFEISTDDNDRTSAVLSLDFLVQVMTIEGSPETLV